MPTYTGTDASETITGSAGDDTIDGRRGDDTLNGLGGADRFVYRTRTTVAASDGSDLIDGGSGTDLLQVDGDNIATTYDPNTDTTVSVPTFSLTAGAGGTVVFAMDQTTTQGLLVTNARSEVTATGVETFRYTAWNGTPSPSSRTEINEDRLTIGDLSGTDMTGLIEFDGRAGHDRLDASAAINQINALGGSGNDRLWTGSGADTLAGGTGLDDLSGGGGDDVFVYASGGLRNYGDENDTFDGGSGTDRLQVQAELTGVYWEVGLANYGLATYSLTAGAGGAVRFTRSQNVEVDSVGTVLSEQTATVSGVETFRFVGATGAVDETFFIGGGDTIYTPMGDDRLSIGDLSGTAMTGLIEFDGGSGDDWLDAMTVANQINALGGTGNDRLSAGSANDTLSGGDADDALIGGAGSNVLDGGAGSDTADYSGATQTVRIDLNDGTVANNGYGQVDTLTGIENLTGGAFNDVLVGQGDANTLIGNAGADYLIGLGGDDVLDGGTGAANTLQGGLGDDRYIVRASGDSLVELANEGIDSVETTLGVFRLGTHFENLSYIGAAAFTGLGNALDNRIVGGSGADSLLGYGGNDYLEGGAGAANTLIGGLGDDTYRVSAVGDTLIEQAGEGHDTVFASVNVTLRDNFEDLRFVGASGWVGTGNALANSIRGDSGRDTLIGMGGDDALEGLAGDDRLRGGLGADILHGGGGVDIADYSDALARITISNGVISSTDVNVTSDTLISIEGYIGSAFNDTMLGGAGVDLFDGDLGSDVLAGYGGNDILAGGSGAANTLIGGLGDDIFRVSALGDTLVEYAGEGRDRVETTLNAYTLRDHIEDLTFTGAGAFTGTGNAGANVIQGGAGNDILIGRGGDDTLNGGQGQDTVDYSAAAAAVTVRLDTNAVSQDGYGGRDTLSSVENATGSAFDDLLFGNSGANVLNGGAGRDTLTGGDGNDVLIGGAGVANTLIGGLGDDRFIVTAVGDSVVESGGQGVDIVETSLAAMTLSANIENLTHTGGGAFTGNGNALNNIITSGAGADTLSGRGGDDAIHAGGGVDTVVMSGLQADYVITQGAGYWSISDTVAGRDGLDVLYDVERIRFSDGSVLELTPPPAPGLALAEEALAKSVLSAEPARGDFSPVIHEHGNPWDAL